MRLIAALFVLFFSSCALPKSTEQPQGLVPRKDILAVSLFREGASFFARGRLVDAELKFRQARYLFPDAENIRFNLAKTLSQLGAEGEAEELLEELLVNQPDSYDYLVGMAVIKKQAEKFSEAKDYYQKALEVAFLENNRQQVAEVARNLSVLAFSQGEIEEAVCFSSLAQGYNANEEQTVRHIRLLFGLGEFESVRKLLSEAFPSDKRNVSPPLLHHAALLAYSEERYVEAYRLADSLSRRKNFDPFLQTEQQMLVALLEEIPEVRKEFRLPEEEADEESTSTVVFSVIPGQSLYWPEPFLEAVYDRREQEEGEDE